MHIKGPKGERIERTYDYVIASQSLKGKITKMDLMEDFESRPHKAVSICDRKRQRGTKNGKNKKCPKRCLASAEVRC